MINIFKIFKAKDLKTVVIVSIIPVAYEAIECIKDRIYLNKKKMEKEELERKAKKEKEEECNKSKIAYLESLVENRDFDNEIISSTITNNKIESVGIKTSSYRILNSKYKHFRDSFSYAINNIEKYKNINNSSPVILLNEYNKFYNIFKNGDLDEIQAIINYESELLREKKNEIRKSHLDKNLKMQESLSLKRLRWLIKKMKIFAILNSKRSNFLIVFRKIK